MLKVIAKRYQQFGLNFNKQFKAFFGIRSLLESRRVAAYLRPDVAQNCALSRCGDAAAARAFNSRKDNSTVNGSPTSD